MDGFDGASGPGPERKPDRPRPAVLSGLRWLWRRGNRARRYAKLKRTHAPKPGEPSKTLDHPPNEVRDSVDCSNGTSG